MNNPQSNVERLCEKVQVVFQIYTVFKMKQQRKIGRGKYQNVIT